MVGRKAIDSFFKGMSKRIYLTPLISQKHIPQEMSELELYLKTEKNRKTLE